MAKRLKRAFTIVELVIVIAVIAILAAVLIPTFTTLIDKANESNDIALVKNLNTALVSKEATDEVNTMQDALDAAYEYGYTVDKLTPSSSGDIVWDEVNNRFALINEKKEVVFEDGAKPLTNDATKTWKIVTELKGTQDCSWYVGGLSKEAIEKFTFTMGVDTGSVEADVNYVTAAEQDVTIHTAGGALTVDAENATVSHYGTAQSVDVQAVDGKNSYHEYGEVLGNISVKKGHFVAESGSSAAAVVVTAANVNEAENVQLTFQANSGVKGIAAANQEVAAILNDLIVSNATQVVPSDEIVDNSFVGGLGTEETPYQISNADEFKSITSGTSDKMKYYVLTEDIHFVESDFVSNYFMFEETLENFVLDGQGHNLSTESHMDIYDGVKHTFVFGGLVGEVVIKNLNLIINSYDSYFTLAYNSTDSHVKDSKLTLECVDVISTEEGAVVTGDLYNNAPYVYYVNNDINFLDCDNYVNYTSTQAERYYAIYVGAYDVCNQGVTVTFENCDNYANVTGAGYTAMFVGNSNLADSSMHAEYEVINCYNYGTIQGAKGAALFSVNEASIYFAELNELYTSSANKGYIGQMAVEGFTYSIEGDKISYQISDMTNISSIYLTLSASIIYYENGVAVASGSVKFTETISEPSASGTFTYRVGKFIDKKTFDGMNTGIELSDENKVIEYNEMSVYSIEYQGNVYYVVVSNLGDGRIGVNAVSQVYITACDAAGQVLGNAVLQENS